jgi:hypothetical protein
VAPSSLPIRELLERATAAQRGLADRAEAIDDEWSYINDLDAAWADRLAAVATDRGDDLADPLTVGAIDEAIRETEAIVDPHRAIDWLSTFPQIVLLALGEPA